jgi:hypothetical protein
MQRQGKHASIKAEKLLENVFFCGCAKGKIVNNMLCVRNVYLTKDLAYS